MSWTSKESCEQRRTHCIYETIKRSSLRQCAAMKALCTSTVSNTQSLCHSRALTCFNHTPAATIISPSSPPSQQPLLLLTPATQTRPPSPVTYCTPFDHSAWYLSSPQSPSHHQIVFVSICDFLFQPSCFQPGPRSGPDCLLPLSRILNLLSIL